MATVVGASNISSFDVCLGTRGEQSSFASVFFSRSRSICTGPASEGAVVSELRRIGAGAAIAQGLGNWRIQHAGGPYRGHVVLGLWSGSLAGKYDASA